MLDKAKNSMRNARLLPSPLFRVLFCASHFTFTVTWTGAENHDGELLFWLGALMRVSLIGFLLVGQLSAVDYSEQTSLC